MMPVDPCTVLKFIRDERIKAVIRGEHANVMRFNREEDEHIEKCVKCATSTRPLYQYLWQDAKIGVDIYATTNQKHS